MDVVKIYKIVIVLLIGMLVFFLTSCEKKVEIITEEIKIDNIESINVKAFGEFNVEYGTESKLVFKGDKAILDILDIKVIKGELIIDSNKDIQVDLKKVKFFVTMPKIKRFEVSGTADVILNDFLQQKEDLSIEILGSANVNIKNFEKVKNLDINVSGNANIDALSNFEELQKLNINISGNGEYNGYLLEANTCYIYLSGNGNCKVYVKKLLNIDIQGNGEVYYKGNPVVRKTIDGAGFLLDQN